MGWAGRRVSATRTHLGHRAYASERGRVLVKLSDKSAVRLEPQVQRGWALSPLSAHFLVGSLDIEKWRHPPHPRGGEDSRVAGDEDPQVTGTATRGTGAPREPRDGT